jgi:tetratricopeptide (TPR) repeat protein
LSFLRNILILIILTETAWAGVVCFQRLSRAVPPVVDLRRLDPLTAAELEQLHLQVRDGSGSSQEWRTLAESYLGNGYYVAAEQCFRKAVELESQDVQARYGRGFCLERVGRTSAAIDVFASTIEHAEPELAKTCWYQIGRCHLREENAELAEVAFRQTPAFAPAAYQLAKLLIRSGRADESIPILSNELSRLPNSLKLLQLRMHAAEAMADIESTRLFRDREDRGEYQLILEYGQNFISLFASRIGLSALLTRAMQVKESGSLQARQNALAEPLSIVRTNTLWQYRSVWIAAAHVELGLGNLNAARELIDEIAQDAHSSPDVMEFRALFAEASGDDESAHELWKRLATMQPSAHFYGQLSVSRANIDGTTRERYRALADLCGAIDAYRVNDSDGAKTLLTSGATVLSGYDRYLFYVGEIDRVLGNIREALDAYEQCLDVNPDHGRAQERYQELFRQLKPAAT